jgi:electron transfer flavoprotein beta subunit
VEILVCVRRVPDTSENEIQLNPAGNDIERDDLVYSINEPDNYAVEEALQMVAKAGGTVTVVTVGSDDDDEEVLRREMAMGANHGVLLSDEAFDGSDGKGIAIILKAFVQKGKYDLILTGVQAEDGGAQVGGMLAAMLDYPFASLVNSIVVDGGKLKVSREIEGGNKEMNEIDLPCVLSIQTGINEPRYVGMRGIRQVASVEVPTFGASDLGVDASAVGDAGAKVKRMDYFMPALGKGAEMLQGDRAEVIAKLIELMKAKGGLN